jgi:hypothetical protein
VLVQVLEHAEHHVCQVAQLRRVLDHLFPSKTQGRREGVRRRTRGLEKGSKGSDGLV